jgi:hypothetical protein
VPWQDSPRPVSSVTRGRQTRDVVTVAEEALN